MFKSLLLLQRKRGMTFEAFQAHYEEVHAPLAASILKPSRYVRNYALAGDVPPPYVKAGYDCITELTFEALPDVSARELKTLREDEARFIDLDSMRVVWVDDRESGRPDLPCGPATQSGR